MDIQWTAMQLAAAPVDTPGPEAKILLIWDDRLWCPSVDHARLARARKRADFDAQGARALDMLPGAGQDARWLLLAAAPSLPPQAAWFELGMLLAEEARRLGLVTLELPGFDEAPDPALMRELILGALHRSFHFDLATAPDRQRPPQYLLVQPRDEETARAIAAEGEIVAYARATIECPPNMLTPLRWIEAIRQRGDEQGFAVRSLGPGELAAMGAGALLAVGEGSRDGAHLLIAEWRGDPDRDEWDAAFLGKGVTFDSGGYNLKPRPNIEKMKFDMAGGAAAIGAVELAARRKSESNVVAIVAVVENMIDANAFRPGDVVRSLSGRTIEVIDTDAEGRLALADAMTFAIRTYTPRAMVDLATLTGSVMAFLHEEFAALYASDDRLATGLVAAGEAVCERLWRMPLAREQAYLAASSIADLSNYGPSGYYGKSSGSATVGAQFLSVFAEGRPWAHIDLTGAAWATRRSARGAAGSTGYGIRLLDAWLRARETAG